LIDPNSGFYTEGDVELDVDEEGWDSLYMYVYMFYGMTHLCLDPEEMLSEDYDKIISAICVADFLGMENLTDTLYSRIDFGHAFLYAGVDPSRFWSLSKLPFVLKKVTVTSLVYVKDVIQAEDMELYQNMLYLAILSQYPSGIIFDSDEYNCLYASVIEALSLLDAQKFEEWSDLSGISRESLTILSNMTEMSRSHTGLSLAKIDKR